MIFDSIKDTFRELRLPSPPFWMVGAASVLVVASWIPLTLIGRSQVARSPLPPIHLIQDMDSQAKFKAQNASDVFVDGRSMRPIVPGTVAREQILDDDHYTQGYRLIHGEASKEVEYFRGMPDRVTVDAKLLKRGQRQFGIMCSHCHGLDGSGNGMVNQRALELVAAGVLNTSLPKTEWVKVANLSQLKADSDQLEFGQDLYADGLLFNTITHGRKNMPPLGSQISFADRWAIVAYVRALQASQHVPVGELTSEQKQQLETP